MNSKFHPLLTIVFIISLLFPINISFSLFIKHLPTTTTRSSYYDKCRMKYDRNILDDVVKLWIIAFGIIFRVAKDIPLRNSQILEVLNWKDIDYSVFTRLQASTTTRDAFSHLFSPNDLVSTYTRNMYSENDSIERSENSEKSKGIQITLLS